MWAVVAIAAAVGLLVAVGLVLRPSTGDPGQSSNGTSEPSDGAPAPSPARPRGRVVHRYVSPRGDDEDRGTRARPWRTIQHAAARVRPGVTVHVAPGRYPGPLTIDRGGTAARPIRFVSERRWRARIAARSSGPLAVVEIEGDHVAFEGFDVTGGGGDGTAAILLGGSQDAVLGNRVHDLAVPCRTTGNGGAGILIGGAGYRNQDGFVARNLVERIGSGRRDGSCRLVHGIYAAVPRVTIVNNIVHHAVGDGITSWHAARELTVANNLAAMNGGAGILIGSGDAGATRAGHRDTLVSNNIVYRNVLYGITESSDGEHPVGPGNRYLHNLAYANRDGDADPGSGVAGLSPRATESRTLNADPRFAPGAVGSGREYSLQPRSPAVDAGTCDGAPRRTFDGAARPQGRGVDIGPRELPSTSGRCDG
jgi:hypothetical protein